MSARDRILLVEDEPLIAMMLEDFVDVLGYTVAGVADSVAGALEFVRSGGIDAAILDVNLRGGEKSTPVADALAASAIPFVFATGGGDEGIAAAHRERPRLDKPFTLNTVNNALAALAG